MMKSREVDIMPRNVYDGETGLPYMVNLYIIKCLYKYVNKHTSFEEVTLFGERKRYQPIYQMEWFNMSRQKMDRVFHGDRFEITREQTENITKGLGIGEQYFWEKEPHIFEIEGLNEDKWKQFFVEKYSAFVDLEEEQEDPSIIKTVEDTLKDIAKKWEEILDKKDPLYAICFYFSTGRRINEVTGIKQLKTLLEEVDCTEWLNEKADTVMKYEEILRRHYQMVSSCATVLRLKNQNK